jgi:hypothetical protein
MLEDFRDHDPQPTEQERQWMEANPFNALIRVLALASLAVAIGLSASTVMDTKAAPTAVASAPQR